MKKCSFVIAIAALTLFLAACSREPDQGPAEQPPATSNTASTAPATRPTSTPTPAGGDATSGNATWTSVTEKVTFCDFPTCSGGQGFTVTSDGNYTIGRGAQPGGQITAEELSSLSAAVSSALTQGAPSRAPACTSRTALPGASSYSTKVTLQDGRTATLIDLSATRSCYLGDQTAADALHEAMHALELKYDPQNGLGSSPGGR